MQEAAAAPLLLTSMGRSAAPLVEGEQLGAARWRRRVGAQRVGGRRRRSGVAGMLQGEGAARWRRRVGARRRGGTATAIEDGSTTREVEEVDEVGAWRSPESTSTTTRLVWASARGGGPPVRADAAGGTQRRSGGGSA